MLSKYVGEPSVESLASGLATLGRYGDEYMVHAAEGETVIPKEILDSNPQLKRDLFRQMMMMGIQDPNRYVVGSNLNSINPVTGQPEFFFKKIFKAVKKVFKKALPVIAPIIGNALLPGIGGIIASGLVTKLQGGSWGDALKSAGMAWAGQGLMGGISGAMSTAPGATFFGGLEQGLTSPFTAIGKLTGSGGIGSLFSGSSPAAATAAAAKAGTAGAGSPALSADFSDAVTTAAPSISVPSIPTGAGPGDDLFAESLGGSGITQDATTLVEPSVSLNRLRTPYSGEISERLRQEVMMTPSKADLIRTQYLADQGAELGDAFEFTQNVATAPTEPIQQAAVPVTRGTVGAGSPALDADFSNAVTMADPARGTVPLQKTDFGGLESFKRTAQQWSPFADNEFTLPDGSKIYGQEALLESRRVAVENATNLMAGKVEKGSDLWNQTIKEAMKRGTSEATPSILQKYGPIAGIGALAYSAFSDDEEEYQERLKGLQVSQEEMRAYDEWKKISDKNSPQAQALYFKWHGQPNRTRSQFEYLTGGPSARPDWMFLPEEYRAMGGEVIGPGTGTSDSIPARLSDGEFVMTADAVRNAGGGDRNLGAARMYDMMRRFEGGTA